MITFTIKAHYQPHNLNGITLFAGHSARIGAKPVVNSFFCGCHFQNIWKLGRAEAGFVSGAG